MQLPNDTALAVSIAPPLQISQVTRPETDVALARLDYAWDALQKARTFDDLTAVWAGAEGIRRYAKAEDLGRGMANEATEIKLRAARKGGQLLAAMNRQKPSRPKEKQSQAETVSPPRLKDLGIGKNQSSRWQQIASVPEPVFEQHLTKVKADAEKELTTASVLEVAKQTQQKQRKETRAAKEHARDAEPIPQIPVRIEVADATALPLPDGSVDLVLTSPPYGLDKPYLGMVDGANGWREFMADLLYEAYRVAKDGGRLALNVPLDTTKPYQRPTYAQAVAAAEEAGWEYRWSIVWNKDNINKTVARGSEDSSAAPHVIAPVEMIGVFFKGEWPRTGGISDLTHAEWLDWTDGLWTFGGETRGWMGHPAPFPSELPRRLIKLLSFRGDTVCDPCSGSGTTVLIAHQLGREAIGFDLSEEYVQQSQRRLAEAIHGAKA